MANYSHEYRSTDNLPYPQIDEHAIFGINTLWRQIRHLFQILSPRLMKYELLRHATLLRYPRDNKPDIVNIAVAGFYSAGEDDAVVCYCCGVTVRGLVATDRPINVHCLLSRSCTFFERNHRVNRRFFKPTPLEIRIIGTFPLHERQAQETTQNEYETQLLPELLLQEATPEDVVTVENHHDIIHDQSTSQSNQAQSLNPTAPPINQVFITLQEEEAINNVSSIQEATSHVDRSTSIANNDNDLERNQNKSDASTNVRNTSADPLTYLECSGGKNDTVSEDDRMEIAQIVSKPYSDKGTSQTKNAQKAIYTKKQTSRGHTEDNSQMENNVNPNNTKGQIETGLEDKRDGQQSTKAECAAGVSPIETHRNIVDNKTRKEADANGEYADDDSSHEDNGDGKEDTEARNGRHQTFLLEILQNHTPDTQRETKLENTPTPSKGDNKRESQINTDQTNNQSNRKEEANQKCTQVNGNQADNVEKYEKSGNKRTQEHGEATDNNTNERNNPLNPYFNSRQTLGSYEEEVRHILNIESNHGNSPQTVEEVTLQDDSTEVNTNAVSTGVNNDHVERHSIFTNPVSKEPQRVIRSISDLSDDLEDRASRKTCEKEHQHSVKCQHAHGQYLLNSNRFVENKTISSENVEECTENSNGNVDHSTTRRSVQNYENLQEYYLTNLRLSWNSFFNASSLNTICGPGRCNSGTWADTENLNTDSAMYPNLESYEARLSTFSNWPIDSPQSREELADAGFAYKGQYDLVSCHFCGKTVWKWKYDDDPWIEHAKVSPNCNYVVDTWGKEFCEALRKGDNEMLAAFKGVFKTRRLRLKDKTKRK